MIVSTATAVLPVWRSPMMSSRWPRPTGTIASIALRPVWTGCDTDWRAITPGATFSITSVSLALMGPLPSIGWPSEFTTRPRSSGPIGTDRILPVVFTVSPSVMCWYSPRITAPTESRSRFSARPKVFFGNSSISPCITSESPWTRQMPSVTETTVPCVRICTPASRFWIRPLMSSEISDGFNCIECSLTFQCRLERAELRARRAVDDFVSDHDLHAADQLAVDVDLRAYLAPGLLFQALDEVGELRIGELEGRVHFGLDHALALVLQCFELRTHLRQQVQAIVLRQHAHKVLRLGVEPAAEDRDEQSRHLRGGQIGVRDRGAHARIRRHFGEGSEHLGPLGQRTRLIGELEGRLGVWTRYGTGLGHLQLALDGFEEIAVCVGVHLTAQDLLGAGDGEEGDAVAQLLARAGHFLLDLRLRSRFLAIAFFLGRSLGFLDHLRHALLGLGDDLGGTSARALDLLVGLLGRGLERALALLGRGQAVSDGLLASLDGAQHRRPHELDREPDERRERDRLRDQRQVEVHAASCRALSGMPWPADWRRRRTWRGPGQ